MEFALEDKEKMTMFKSMGFNPECVFDIGASNGGWTRVAAEVFPNSAFYMFEPLGEISSSYKDGLMTTLKSGINCHLYPFALGEKCGSASIAIDSHYYSSSFLPETQSDYFPTSANVQMITIDAVVRDMCVPSPQLIKLDVQGYELEILKGAKDTLKHTEMLLIETWLVRGYGPKTPLLFELASWLAQHNFFLLDFSGNYRDESGLLIAQDCFFVKEPNSFIKIDHDRSFAISNNNISLSSIN